MNSFQSQSSAEAAKASYKSKAAVLLTFALLMLLIGAILAAYFYATETRKKNIIVCATDDCAAFGLELSAAINKTADPCQDFHAYVCGDWNDPRRQVSTEARMRVAALNVALKEIRASKSSKAAQFYESCVGARPDLKENLRQFAELRRSLGLIWPERSTQAVKHPLDVMIDLALNWQMNFLFDMSVIVVRQSPTLLVSRGRMDAIWEEDMHNPRTPEQYQLYVRDYYEILGVGASQSRTDTDSLIQIEQDFVDAKLQFLYDAPRQDWFSVNTLDSKTPTLPPGLWLSCLAKHDKQFSWSGRGMVIVEDVRILESIEKLMKKYTREDLIMVLSWIFLQTHLWAVCGTPSLRFRGSYSELKSMQEHGCMAYVESLLGLLGTSKVMAERYGHVESRLQAYSFLHRISEHIKTLVNQLPWMDEESKLMAFNKLDNMSRTVMPGDSFFVKKNREELYAVFPDMSGKTFMTNLLGASEVYRRLRNHDRFEDVYSVRIFPRFGREFYLYLPNSMTLAIGDLNPPLFYHNATLAIRYGGLGSMAGRQMVKAFDEVGVNVDSAGVRGQWLKPAAAAAHAEKSQCDVRATTDSTRWRPLRMFPSVVGMEAAFASFVAAVTVDYRSLDDLRVMHLEQFTDNQIFFLAFCYSQCSKLPQTKGDECNVPVKNSPQFAEAFKCPPNAPMNPPKKCTFFEQ
ncbi:hypothetical protein HPB50_016190 [Hyalomma asiaticum]|uniref:Uncharacterized protein n=1 Tax=Hyalomma asiaticum TaxID=266040 RepID=A0ACB7RZF0_HYAAI|nr:hypothetical protein HPB50_016190 [Hyalomma asiaticum]